MKVMVFEQQLNLPVSEVWTIISTSAGMQRFLAPRVTLDLSVDGLLDVWFFPENPVGMKGAENMRILAIEAPSRLQFTWNQPPFLQSIRQQRTVVECVLIEQNETTLIQLNHTGWGRGCLWKQAQNYFSGAWPVVLKRLAFVCDGHEIDWQQVPKELSFEP